MQICKMKTIMTTMEKKRSTTVKSAWSVGSLGGTINGAHASFSETPQGSVEPGKLGDLVVLGRDPVHLDPSKLIAIPIERSMTGGKRVYES